MCLGDILCNNKGALNQAAITRNRVRVSAKHANLLRSLQLLKSRTNIKFVYIHVKAHQDKYLAWQALSLVEQLNGKCNALVGQVVAYGISECIKQG